MVKIINVLVLGILTVGCGQGSETSSPVNQVTQVQVPEAPSQEPEPEPEPESTVKRLTCTDDFETVQWTLDTKDFSKENPEAEYTLVRRDSSDEQSAYAELIDQNLTSGELWGVGQVYRVKYDTTPQYLTFEVPRYPGCPYEVKKLLETIGTSCEQSATYSVFRQTLIGQKDNSEERLSCVIETFDVKSNQI